jgi:hypothetical protein
MNPASNQPEPARRRRPPHGSSRAGLASSGLRRAVGLVVAIVSFAFSLVETGVGVGVSVVVGGGVGGAGPDFASWLAATIRDARNRSDRGRSADQRGSARLVLRLAAGLLRGEVRAEWLEESEKWLLDLRKAGEPWYRLLAEQLSLLTRLPWLVMIYWLSARRAVDR